MFYDDPNRQKRGPDDDTTGQKGGQTGTEDNLGDLDEMDDITTEDEVKNIEDEVS